MRLLYEAPSLVNTLAKHRAWGQLDLASRTGLILGGEVDLRDALEFLTKLRIAHRAPGAPDPTEPGAG